MMIKKLSNKIAPLAVSLLCVMMLAACSGMFATDKNLSNKFQNERGDRELSIFFTPNKDNMTVALKNVGYSFMTNLRVSFECVKDTETITEIYSIGHLKAYFNKNISVPFNYYQCKSLLFSYYFIPMPDGGAGFTTDRNFIDPRNPVENSFRIK